MRRHQLASRIPRDAQRGSALVMATIAVGTLTLLSLAFFQIGQAANAAVEADADDTAAFYLAEAAMAESIEALRAGAAGIVGTRDTPAVMADGVFWVESVDIGGNERRLTCTALLRSGRASLEAIVNLGGDTPMFPGMMLARNEIKLAAKSFVDSFDSTLGTYASQATNTHVAPSGEVFNYAGINGHILSNMDVVVHAEAKVFGDAKPGPGYSTTLMSDAYVNGSTTPSIRPFYTPEVAPPTIASSGDLTVTATDSLPPGDYAFDTLLIKEGELTITGPATLVVQDFETFGKTPRMVVDATNGPVDIYVVESFNYDGDFRVSHTAGSPLDLVWMISPGCDRGTLTFPTDSVVQGGLYAPNHSVSFGTRCNVEGAFVVNELTMSNSTMFHCDEELFARTIPVPAEDEGAMRIVSWNRTAVATEFTRDRRDPELVLDIDMSTLPHPADAWGTVEDVLPIKK